MQIIAINYSLKIWIPLSERWRNLAFQSVLRRRNFFIQSESLTKQTSFYDFEKLIQRKKIQRFSGFLYYVMVRVVPTTYKDGINLIEIGVIYSIIWLYVDLSRLYFIKIYFWNFQKPFGHRGKMRWVLIQSFLVTNFQSHPPT